MNSASQLEFKLKQWRFRKNLSPQAWEFVADAIRKRKRDGKLESQVVCCGVPLPEKKVKKALARYALGPVRDCRSLHHVTFLMASPWHFKSPLAVLFLLNTNLLNSKFTANYTRRPASLGTNTSIGIPSPVLAEAYALDILQGGF